MILKIIFKSNGVHIKEWDEKIKKFETNDQLFYCVLTTTKKETKLTSDLLQTHNKEMKKAEWESFDEYINCANKIRYIEVNVENWLFSKCSCSWWSKYYLCKHSIGVCEALNYLEFSEQAKQIKVLNKEVVVVLKRLLDHCHIKKKN
jgi:hypothetical protein